MKRIAILLASLYIAGCCTVFKHCPNPQQCEAQPPKVLTEYVVLPEHLTTPCKEPEELVHGNTWQDEINAYGQVKSDLRACNDQIDLIRKTNDAYKAKKEGP